MANTAIKVEGSRELAKAVRNTKDKELGKELRLAHKAAADVVAQEAKTLVPERSGKLKKSIRARGTTKVGTVLAGTAKTVPYAHGIHFGWPKRNIRPQPFLYEASDKRAKQVREVFNKRITELTDKLSSRGR